MQCGSGFDEFKERISALPTDQLIDAILSVAAAVPAAEVFLRQRLCPISATDVAKPSTSTAAADASRAPPDAAQHAAPPPGNAVKTSAAAEDKSTKKSKRVQQDEKFDMSLYRQRQIAFQIQYDGTKYLGFASQDCSETIENHLFSALQKLRLIEDSKVTKLMIPVATDLQIARVNSDDDDDAVSLIVVVLVLMI